MKAVLIPVKDLGAAKQRLAPVFTQTERTEIAWLMLEHVFAEVSSAQGLEKIFVVTSYEPAADLAGKLGMEVIPETTQISESRSVDYASRICRKRGVTTLLRIPIDLPFIVAGDVEDLLARAAPAPSALLVPSRTGDGTNALLRSPPGLFPTYFGRNSFALHLQESRRVGAATQVIRSSSLAFDLDEPADLRVFLAEGNQTPLFDLLSSLDASGRIRAAGVSSRTVPSLSP